MGNRYIGTISLADWTKRSALAVLQRLDPKEIYFGFEVGRTGYRHIQFCCDISGDLEQYQTRNSLGWHIERAISWDKSIAYCRKGGDYAYFGDSIEEREYRRTSERQPTYYQRAIERTLARQNDRQITVWVDRIGGHGKTTLVYSKSRAGKWMPIPRTEQSANRIIDYVALHYENEEAIVLDLPRQRDFEGALIEALEDIKDGLITSSKYEGHRRFIRGVKVLVLTNNDITPEQRQGLSQDRWDIWPRVNSPEVILTIPPRRGGNRKKKRTAPKGGAPLPPEGADC